MYIGRLLRGWLLFLGLAENQWWLDDSVNSSILVKALAGGTGVDPKMDAPHEQEVQL